MTAGDSHVSSDHAKSDRQVREFYDKLRLAIKRHSPEDYGYYIVDRIRLVENDIAAFRQSPYHWLLHSLEANCAYTWSSNHAPVTFDSFRKIMNTYHGFNDPLLDSAAYSNIDHFARLLHREQLELQYGPSKNELARAWRLFVTSSHVKRTPATFLSQFGVTIANWICISLASYVCASTDHKSRVVEDAIRSCKLIKIDPHQISQYYAASSLAPRDIGKRFLEVRNDISPFFYGCLRSAFLETPLMDLGKGVHLAPLPDLVFRHCIQGLYRLCRQCEHFGQEFGRSFEQYVGELTSELAPKRRIVSEKDLRHAARSKSCDLLIESNDEILLVECKATSFIANNLTENAIVCDNSTGKIVEATEQLYSTAYDLKEGRLNSLKIESGKPCYGIIVTFGDLPFANSSWYRQLLLSRASDKLKPPIYPGTQLKAPPVIIPIGTLEALVKLMSAKNATFESLYNEKEQQNYHVVGDWDSFCGHELKECGEVPKSELLEHAFSQVFAAVGVSVGDKRS
ncbi:MAG: hypothetical protein IT441_05825 [Phycisphaeraceae bacterium]|nr:hypothetical protein [Phycisphaeraceae bacterium]